MFKHHVGYLNIQNDGVIISDVIIYSMDRRVLKEPSKSVVAGNYCSFKSAPVDVRNNVICFRRRVDNLLRAIISRQSLKFLVLNCRIPVISLLYLIIRSIHCSWTRTRKFISTDISHLIGFS